MKKALLTLLVVFFGASSLFITQKYFVGSLKANAEVEALQKEIYELEHLKQLSEDATKPLED